MQVFKEEKELNTAAFGVFTEALRFFAEGAEPMREVL